VLGEWCNLGADTNTSNLKNNYDEVKLWNYNQEKFEKTGLQFCGLIMGDHSKTSINTMLNTGTVIGVSSNIFGSGFPRNFVPSFAWGGASGFSTYQIAKALVTSKLVYKRRKKEFGLDEEHVFEHLFAQESKFRIWENK
jgi:UDP-N-acetylmuramyl pentapeptide synthase